MDYPILGSAHYHWAGFGEERTAIAEAAWDGDRLCLRLADGREVRLPPDAAPILRDAAPEERAAMEIEHGGDAGHEMIVFPLLNTEISLAAELAARLNPHDAAGLVVADSEEAAAAVAAEILLARAGADHRAQERLLAMVRRRMRRESLRL